MSTLQSADPALFAAYQKFTEAYEQAQAARTADSDAGSGGNATPEQKRAHEYWEQLLGRSEELARELTATPAQTIEGMLLKIHIAGYWQEKPGKAFKPLLGAPDWVLLPPHRRDDNGWAFCTDDQALLAGLRDDLRRLGGAA